MSALKQDSWAYKILEYLKIGKEIEDSDSILESIQQDMKLSGINLWILVFAVIIACVGLNMNSTAVVIGAMLISPIIGPINGIGFSIATYDFVLFRKALRNFLFGVVASLIASTIYFSLSPIDTAYTELLQRTSPTIFDVIIAFFGGTAGMIAISSRHKGNVIPGVAIASALLPPLCTAGYGLATGQFYYFFGAFYLFTINTVFIAFAALIVSQFLKFPILKEIDEHRKSVINRWIYVVIFLVLGPSIFFGYRLVQKEKFTENATKFIEEIRIVEGNYLLKNEVYPATRKIILTYGGTNLSEDEKVKIRNKSDKFELNNSEISFKQGLSFSELSKKGDEVDVLKTEMSRLGFLLITKDKQIDSLQKRKYIGKDLLIEIKTLFPQITSFSYTDSYLFSDLDKTPERVDIVVIHLKNGKLKNEEEDKIHNWLVIRLKSKNLKVYYE